MNYLAQRIYSRVKRDSCKVQNFFHSLSSGTVWSRSDFDSCDILQNVKTEKKKGIYLAIVIFVILIKKLSGILKFVQCEESEM